MWVLLEGHNDYNQHGDYFIACWHSKPSRDELKKFFPNMYQEFLDAELDHLLNGGGRKDVENSWFILVEMKNGERY